MLRLVSDVFPTLMLYSWRTFRLLSPVLSGWISILTWHQYTFNVSIEIQPLNTGDKSLKVRQEYNINVGKTSLTKHNFTALFLIF